MQRGMRALMICALVAGCAFDDGEQGDEQYDEIESQVVGAFADGAATNQAQRMNPHRREHANRGAMDRRACLNDIARRRARRMADNQCPGGDSICHFGGLGNAITDACPFNWEAYGENVGVGPTESGLWQAFLGSPPHHDNIDGRWNRFGVGAYRRSSDNMLFIAHVFVRTP